MTLFGALAMALMARVELGLWAIGLALLGESAEALILWRILKRPDGPGRRLRRIAAAVAGFQALTIGGCIWICWGFIPIAEAKFFALVFLMAAVTNAGMASRHFPEGTVVRYWVYALVTVGMLTELLLTRRDQGAVFLILAVLILTYAVALFMNTVSRSRADRYRFERALLDEQVQLSLSRAELEQTARRYERLALVARYAGDSVMFTTPDGRIEWVNEAFSRITGYSFDEAVGQLPGDLLNAPDTEQEALAELLAAIEEGRPCRVEIKNRTKAGGIIWMDINMSPVFSADGRLDVFISVERDITEAKAQQIELAAARQVAEAASRAKSQFLATMSHEIRTPMNGVIGVAELLADTTLDTVQRDYVATIVESGRALLTIINDVLDLSKLEAGRMDLAEEDFDLAALIGRSIELLRPVAQGRGLWLEADLPGALPRHRGDPGRLRQVLLNLLGNAVKFTETGGVRLRLDWRPGEQVDRIDLHVEDTGIGIPPERQAQVFDSFAQADNTIGRRFGGTGLGLTISREMVRRMGGDISLVSAPGHGSTFTISLPLARAEAATAGPQPGLEAPRTALRILVAEDNRTNALIVRRLLEPCVAAFHAAEDGAAAVAAWEQQRPDLILMDVSMPGMDGLEATRVIRTAEQRAGLPRVPIFALTAYSDAEHQAAFIVAGMDGALTKPFLRAELFTLLRHVAAGSVPGQPQPDASGFDLSPGFALDREAKGEAAWSTSHQGCTTTTGRSTRSSGR
ncbi:PAS domain-containing hybrid sensor histidine kinase/response regulator [Gemmobacter sp.]|uniref:hybrid sensor histidine kinase/response regulator n=1 Tax=Gemmobacter sp. TaxID=1898957 RepID=UPI0025C58F0E|nr:PAS domain-containing hybrid sensor histidine kinase/response regulator [Gemmobacter sp.]